MSEINYTFNNFNNYGCMMFDLTDELLAPVMEEVNEIQANFDNGTKFNDKLAGNIRKEFELTKCFKHLENLVLPFVVEYDKHFGYFKSIKYTNHDLPIGLNDIWVNFQQKYEFNPMHDHAGVMSFVIWLKVPFTMEEEAQFMPEIPADRKCNGLFSLYYTDALGNIRSHDLPVDKSYEKKLLLFPATMRHSVYPFYTSDDYRISVSGNFLMKAFNR